MEKEKKHDCRVDVEEWGLTDALFGHAGILVTSENMLAVLFYFYCLVIWKFKCSCRFQAFARWLVLSQLKLV